VAIPSACRRLSIRDQKRDHTEINSLHTPDSLVTDNIKKAEALNAQFKSVFTIEPYYPQASLNI